MNQSVSDGIAADLRRRKSPSRDSADRLPPHNTECEQGVLGCILMSPRDCLDQCAIRLETESFYDLRHQTIWSAIVEIGSQNIDIISLQQRLKDGGMLEQIGGIPYLNALQDSVPSAANLSYYLDIVAEKYQLRKIIQTCTDVVGRVYDFDGTVDELLDEVEHSIAKVGNKKSTRASTSADAFIALTHDLEERMNRRESGKRSGLETGWYDLDRLTDGLQLGEQCVIGARPSMGKTAIASNLIENICFKNKIPSAFLTCEMRPQALMRRMAASQCRIAMSSLRGGNLTQGDMAKLATFGTTARNSPLHWIDGVSGINEAQACSEIRRLVRKHGVQFVVIDYLQKVKASKKDEKKTYEVGSVSSAFNALAKELNIAIVTLAQLNRENEKDKGRMPRLSDLGDSKQIEQDADMIALLHRQRSNAEHIPTDLIIAKQRDGELGIVNLMFTGMYQRFENASTHEEKQ